MFLLHYDRAAARKEETFQGSPVSRSTSWRVPGDQRGAKSNLVPACAGEIFRGARVIVVGALDAEVAPKNVRHSSPEVPGQEPQRNPRGVGGRDVGTSARGHGLGKPVPAPISTTCFPAQNPAPAQ